MQKTCLKVIFFLVSVIWVEVVETNINFLKYLIFFKI